MPSSKRRPTKGHEDNASPQRGIKQTYDETVRTGDSAAARGQANDDTVRTGDSIIARGQANDGTVRTGDRMAARGQANEETVSDAPPGIPPRNEARGTRQRQTPLRHKYDTRQQQETRQTKAGHDDDTNKQPDAPTSIPPKSTGEIRQVKYGRVVGETPYGIEERGIRQTRISPRRRHNTRQQQKTRQTKEVHVYEVGTIPRAADNGSSTSYTR